MIKSGKSACSHPFDTQGESLNDVDRIISDLEHQRAAIERAIEALREISVPGGTARGAQSAPAAPAARKRRLSAEGRRRIAEATRRRWALKRAEAAKAAGKK